jgi:hypothetical protein
MPIAPEPREHAAAAQASAAGVWRFDVVAGLTAAAVVLPKAMAYAAVAGLPVAVGLYTAFIPMIVYALLGTSRVLSVSSTTTLAILAGTELALVVPDGDPARLVTATALRSQTLESLVKSRLGSGSMTKSSGRMSAAARPVAWPSSSRRRPAVSTPTRSSGPRSSRYDRT